MSTTKRTTLIVVEGLGHEGFKDLPGGLEIEHSAGSVVELMGDGIEIILAVDGEIGSLGQEEKSHFCDRRIGKR